MYIYLYIYIIYVSPMMGWIQFENMKIYLHFITFLNTEVAQAVTIFPRRRLTFFFMENKDLFIPHNQLYVCWLSVTQEARIFPRLAIAVSPRLKVRSSGHVGWMGETFSGSGSWPPLSTTNGTLRKGFRSGRWKHKWFGKFIWIAAL